MKDEGQLFFLGQAVTMKESGDWDLTIVYGSEKTGIPPAQPPEFGKIYHVGGYYMSFPGEWDIWLVELGSNDVYEQTAFVPVISSAKLETMLAEAFEEVIL